MFLDVQIVVVGVQWPCNGPGEERLGSQQNCGARLDAERWGLRQEPPGVDVWLPLDVKNCKSFWVAKKLEPCGNSVCVLLWYGLHDIMSNECKSSQTLWKIIWWNTNAVSWKIMDKVQSLVLGFFCLGLGEAGRKPEGVALEQSIRKCLRQIYKAHWLCSPKHSCTFP